MIFKLFLLLSVLLSSLTAGFLFAFAVVVMPGIHNLQNREFILAFQSIDGIIQRGQPLFGVMWAGSVLALIVAAVMGISRLEGMERLLLLGATLVYLLGVQLPTITVNVPLNNSLQRQRVETMSEHELENARQAFEPRWNTFNIVRTLLAVVVAAMLILLVFRM